MDTPKIPASDPNKQPQTLAEFYAFYWSKLFKKLNKNVQTHIEENRIKPTKIIRGREMRDPIVRDFVREVAKQAEEAFDKIKII